MYYIYQMNTEVIMKRELFGCEVSQKSKSEFFSATDLVKAGNRWRLSNGYEPFNMAEWFRTKKTKEFVEELESRYGQIKINSRGRNSHTWVHPLLFIDIALAISPKLKIEVYEWLFDHLIRHRNDSGDSYKEMTSALYIRHSNYKEFPKYISKVAEQIKTSCKVDNWQSANEDQLKLRDKIHRSIKTLCIVLDNPDDAVRIGINENIR